MSGLALTAISVAVGLGGWLAVRLGVPLSEQPAQELGIPLKISVRELVQRTMWVSVVVLAALPVYFGLATAPAYQEMLVPMLSGVAGAELLLGRWEKRQARLRIEREEERRRERRRKRREGQTPPDQIGD